MKEISIYIHIPFCKSKCSYCNFVSFVNCENYFEEYVQSLIKEIKLFSKECKNTIVKTIYVGGGTPSILKAESIANILNEIYANYNIDDNVEITVEANPNSLTYEKVKIWADAKVNRVSVGLQAKSNKLLKLLNRPHNYNDFKNAIQQIKRAGITNISTDILIGLPRQKWLNINRTINKLIKLKVNHISAYGLILEPETKLYKQVESGELKIPNDDKSVKFYQKTRKKLEKNGYFCYEISNFAKIGYESKHNLNYWARGEFIGFGVAAYCFYNGVHWENTTSLSEYLKNEFKKLNIEKETEKTAKEEFIMLALRTTKGLDISKFNQTFKTDFKQEYAKQLNKLINNNTVKIENEFLKVIKTEITNLIIEEFF